MKVVWHKQAKEGRDQVANYIGREFGRKRKMRFLQDVRQMTQMLKSSPSIGQIDPLFEDRSITYRSVIINSLNKMIYYVDGSTLQIADFWDTRQEPQARADQTE